MSEISMEVVSEPAHANGASRSDSGSSQRLVTEAVAAQILELHKAGKQRQEIAAILGRNRKTVSAVLIGQGVKLRGRRNVSDTDRDNFCREHAAGQSFIAIAKKYDRSETVVRFAVSKYFKAWKSKSLRSKSSSKSSPKSALRLISDPLSEAEQGRILAMRRAGKTAQQIATLMKCDYGSVARVIDNDDVVKPKSAKFKSAKYKSAKSSNTAKPSSKPKFGRNAAMRGGDPSLVPKDVVARILAMHKKGDSTDNIGSKLHRSFYTICNVLELHGLKGNVRGRGRVVTPNKEKSMTKMTTTTSTASTAASTSIGMRGTARPQLISRDAVLFEVLSARLGKKNVSEAFDEIAKLVGE